MVIVLSDYDSRIKWGLTLGQAICKSLNLSEDLLHLYYKSASNELFELYGFNKKNAFSYTNISKLATKKFLLNIDILILAVGGTDNFRILSKCNDIENRPICITGFNGVIDSQDPHGLLCRVGSDFICINNEFDLKNSQKILRDLHLDCNSLICTGYLRKQFDHSIGILPFNYPVWLFVEQIGIPNTLSRMLYLFDALVALAVRNPNVKIVIKCRSQKGIDNVNSKKDRSVDLRDIFRVHKSKVPANLSIDDLCSIEQLILKADLCIAFSSTVLLEALFLNKKIAVLTDFGIDKKIGNYVFLGSGVLINSYQINQDNNYCIDSKWLKEHCTFNQLDVFMNKLKSLLLRKNELGVMNLYYCEHNVPFFYSNVHVSWLLKIVLKVKKCLN